MLWVIKNENQRRRYLIVALGEIIFAQFSLSNQPFGCGVVIEISGHMRFSPFDTRMPYHDGKNTRNGLGEMRLNLVPSGKVEYLAANMASEEWARLLWRTIAVACRRICFLFLLACIY